MKITEPVVVVTGSDIAGIVMFSLIIVILAGYYFTPKLEKGWKNLKKRLNIK